MLLAPLLPVSLTQPSARKLAQSRRRDTGPLLTPPARRAVLVGWALLGALALLCIPALRGGPQTGWTLPFWLLAAPLLNLAALAWLQRGANAATRRR